MVDADAGSAGQTASTADVRERGTLGALTVVFLISAVWERPRTGRGGNGEV